jgi:hypothetical protein
MPDIVRNLSHIANQQALRLANPQQSGYVTRWPIYGTSFNARDYPSIQFVLSDFEAIIRHTLKEKFDIDMQDYSVGLYRPAAHMFLIHQNRNIPLFWSSQTFMIARTFATW